MHFISTFSSSKFQLKFPYHFLKNLVDNFRSSSITFQKDLLWKHRTTKFSNQFRGKRSFTLNFYENSYRTCLSPLFENLKFKNEMRFFAEVLHWQMNFQGIKGNLGLTSFSSHFIPHIACLN